MPVLNDYLKQTQRFMRDARQDLLNPGDLVEYINRARREIAMRAQCIRVLTPISGSVISATVTEAGTGYDTGATVTITDPDFPSGRPPEPEGALATAQAIVQNGTVAAVNIEYGGYGYYQPTASVTGEGSGASVTLEISTINQLVAGQEIYALSDVDLTASPGVESVYMVLGISIIYANYRYSLACYSFSQYQAKIRQYPFQYQYVPAFCTQHGQGANGTFMVYPLPSQAYQFEMDCFCLPANLITNLSEEALPAPWTEAVPYFAAYLAYNELQNLNIAKYYLEQFDNFSQRYSNYARPGRAVTYYGRP